MKVHPVMSMRLLYIFVYIVKNYFCLNFLLLRFEGNVDELISTLTENLTIFLHDLDIIAQPPLTNNEQSFNRKS